MPIKFSDLPSVDFAKIDSLVGLSKDNNGWYNNIIPKHTIMNNIDEQIKNMFNLIFPVGSLYLAMCHFSICPLQEIGVGKWELTARDKCIQGSGTHEPDTSISAGLPSISHTHSISKEKVVLTTEGNHAHGGNTLNVYGYFGGGDGYFGDGKVFKKFNNSDGGAGVQAGNKFAQQKYEFRTAGNWSGSTSIAGSHTHYISGTTDINSTINGIYGTSNTVQPPAYVVDVWKRKE